MNVHFEPDATLYSRHGSVSDQMAIRKPLPFVVSVEEQPAHGLWYTIQPATYFFLAIFYLLMMCVFGLIEATGIQVIKARDD
jgi:hypothetical protein